MIFSFTLITAGSVASRVNTPSSVSRSPVILPPSIDTLRRWVSCGRPRYSAMMAGTAPPTPSVDSLPAITSSVPSMVPNARAKAHPVWMTSEPCMPSSFRWTALSAPIDSALRIASVARSGPAVSTVTDPSMPSAASFSRICSASSTARSLISSSTASAASRSSVKSPSVSLRSDQVSGTCLIRTTMFVMTVVRPPRRRPAALDCGTSVTRFATAQRYYYSVSSRGAPSHHSGW
ncbi:Uncharacterised protein [Mycobacterium tuberculosis]|nr:Uncharacterised protein [Mycobacterium tuberculosis]